MKDLILKNWKTTLIGLLLAVITFLKFAKPDWIFIAYILEYYEVIFTALISFGFITAEDAQKIKSIIKKDGDK